MAFTEADLDRLKRALREGVTKVRHADGRETNYRSLSEMQGIINMIQSDLDKANGAPVPSRRIYANSRKGL